MRIVSGYLSVSMQKDISGWQFFLVYFNGQSWGTSWILTVSTKQGKKYHNSIINVNFVNFNSSNCWSCIAYSFDMLQAMFEMNFFQIQIFRPVQKCQPK